MDNFTIQEKVKSVLVDKLQSFKNQTFKSDQDLKSLVDTMFTASEIKIIQKILDNMKDLKSGYDLESVIANLHDEIQASLKKLSLLELFLSFEPTIGFEESIIDEISEKLNISFVYKIVVDESIVAGAIIDFNGHRYDYSLSDTFKEISI